MLEKKIQDILDRMPKITDVPHVFYSSEADSATGGLRTAVLKDEFGGAVRINFVGGCSIDVDGNIIPSIDEESGAVILSDHSPEIPKLQIEG